MEKERLIQKIQQLRKALNRLQESLKLDIDNDIVIDGVIKRFEFCYEISWKTLKSYLEYKGIVEAKAPRDVIKEAFSIGLIEEGEKYISMLKDRNLTVHTYDQKTADIIYRNIKKIYVEEFKKLTDKLENEEKYL
ncbi:MAG: nucleotidyltransferase substrate binding protein [Clostridia bacterium]|nr:nucleotidyltransferase substrate binding protein [Clostridia bacterium]MDD4049264.1 nucleotidyltransferase substrate binding protein [Clostridia bacterium]